MLGGASWGASSGITGCIINDGQAEWVTTDFLDTDENGVIPDSPAEKAGLRGSGTDERGQPTFGGDIISNVDGQTVASVEDLIAYFNGKKPGDEVSLSIYRGDKTLTIKVTLGEWPEQMTSSQENLFPRWFWLVAFCLWSNLSLKHDLHGFILMPVVWFR